MTLFGLLKKNTEFKMPLSKLELYMLDISSDSKKELEKANYDNDIERYKDILFRAMLHDDKHPWWHTQCHSWGIFV
nr:hypothetical protein [uncultured Acetatifactor sp.]